jgi:hypothetical protein
MTHVWMIQIWQWLTPQTLCHSNIYRQNVFQWKDVKPWHILPTQCLVDTDMTIVDSTVCMLTKYLLAKLFSMKIYETLFLHNVWLIQLLQWLTQQILCHLNICRQNVFSMKRPKTLTQFAGTMFDWYRYDNSRLNSVYVDQISVGQNVFQWKDVKPWHILPTQCLVDTDMTIVDSTVCMLTKYLSTKLFSMKKFEMLVLHNVWLIHLWQSLIPQTLCHSNICWQNVFWWKDVKPRQCLVFVATQQLPCRPKWFSTKWHETGARWCSFWSHTSWESYSSTFDTMIIGPAGGAPTPTHPSWTGKNRHNWERAGAGATKLFV